MAISLQLVIDMPVDGHFYWMIVRPGGTNKPATVVDCASGPAPCHEAAHRAGSDVLDSYLEAENRQLAPSACGAWNVVTCAGALV